jgi:UDP-N-acetylmuramoyl-tripeptide--D-alanyl-D-alanine ligase
VNNIILDAYNANPSSMFVAIENFLQLNGQPKVLILGDMFELGTESLQEHQNIIQLLTSANSSVQCLFVGKDFYTERIAKPNLQFYENFESLISANVLAGIKDSYILIKGSRGMALERSLDYL